MSAEQSMQPRYDPHGVEERWQRTWEEEGLYNADVDASREPYVDAHPPPNVTGELHIGHALQLAIGDTMIRWKRMQGFNAVFHPGYDPARIAADSGSMKPMLAGGAARPEPVSGASVALVLEGGEEVGGNPLRGRRRRGQSPQTFR